MRSTEIVKPPLVGRVLKTPIRCPECNDILVADDTCVVIIRDVVCKKCRLIVITIKENNA